MKTEINLDETQSLTKEAALDLLLNDATASPKSDCAINPYLLKRAIKVIDFVTFLIWVSVLILLVGSVFNYCQLERVEIYATSHDARIEATAQPIKI